MTDLKVVAAAIRKESGEVFSVPQPGRHDDVIALMREKFAPYEHGLDEQGFLLSDGRFARRKPALVVAISSGQLAEDKAKWPQHGLFSEDLW